jgi:hypothetical protein
MTAWQKEDSLIRQERVNELTELGLMHALIRIERVAGRGFSASGKKHEVACGFGTLVGFAETNRRLRKLDAEDKPRANRGDGYRGTLWSRRLGKPHPS